MKMIKIKDIVSSRFSIILVVAIASVLFFTQCQNDETAKNDVVSIDVANPVDSINNDSFMQKAKYSAVIVKSDYPLSNIKDLCLLNDSLCYIIDTSNALVCVNIETGDIVKFSRKIGRAKDEVVMPNMITTDGGEYVYIVDAGKHCIMVFNPQLEYQYSIPVNGFPDKIIKTEDGFLLYTSGEDASVSLVNTYGREVYSRSFFDADIEGRYSCAFAKDEKGSVYMMSEYSDTIYKWSGQEMLPVYCLDYSRLDNSQIDSGEGRRTLRYFVIDDKIVFSFMEGKNVEFGIYDIKTKEVRTGYPNPKDGIYFMPQYQYDCMLIAVLDDDLLSSVLDMSQEDNKDVKLLFWKYIIKNKR